MQIEYWSIDKPKPYLRNARKIPEKAIAKVAKSLEEFGWKQPLVVDAEGVIVVGHTRLLAAKRLGWNEVPVVVASDLTPAQVKAYRLMDNRSHDETDWDLDILNLELNDLSLESIDLALTGFELPEIERALLNGLDDAAAEDRATLADRFGIPPFSVLDARQGYWQNRKRAWLALGIKSELGRAGGGRWLSIISLG